MLRQIGAGLTAPALGLLAHPARAAPLAALVLYGPPAGPSIVLAEAVASGGLAPLAANANLRVWRNPDEMRAGLTSGTMAAVVLPVQVAANLYNRGMKLKLLNIMTKGLLYIIAADPRIDSLPALKGRKLAVPFRNDMPDFIIEWLLAHYRLVPGTDVALEYAGSPVEAVQLLLTGRVDAVLAAEPAATGATIRGKLLGKSIRRAIDVQQVWGQANGREPVLPQAGLALLDSLTAANPGLADGLQAALEAAAAKVNANPSAAAAHAAPALDFPESILAASIPSSNLAAMRARTARPAIEAMLRVLAERDPAIIAGRLPDDGFYL